MNAEAVRNLIQERLLDDLDCEVVEGDAFRFGCQTPLEYPRGDSIVVWVEPRGDQFEVSDLGEAYVDVVLHPPKDRGAFEDLFAQIARGFALNDDDGNLSGVGPAEQIGDLVWRVASASAQVAQAATLVPRKADHKDHAFEREVAEALREREVPVEHRRRKLVGQSERVHKVTFYVPERNAVLEPVTAHWNSASNVYTRLGDLGRAQANGNGGYGLFSIVDDKRAADAEKIEQLLAQVSNVVPWTQHEEWLAGLTSSRGT